ncbi:MAG: alpha-glucan family phosphorylase [Candidatus Thermoplasmatota archaeon]|nr:alpha-glucan family phosphorylase [Candidatus Thermoplasmatota archaeon]
MTIVYLTAEIGLKSDLHTYSGGLGVLAGDHVKSAADAGIDLVAVTLLYRQGYSEQHLDDNGIQTESYRDIDPAQHLVDTGVEITLPLDGTKIQSRLWKMVVEGVNGSTVDVIFLDTRHPENPEQFVNLGERLYGGDDSTRIRQEYLLGVGGIHALDALGIEVGGLHLNEGHCTFAALEMLNRGWSREELKQKTLFTTHTPVPAGHDRFAWPAVEEVLGDLLPDDVREIANSGDTCSMSHLGIGLCGSTNAVSKLNAEVASEMFRGTRIHPITNGIHHITWTSTATANLFDEQIQDWRSNPERLREASGIPADALTMAREKNRSYLRQMVEERTGVILDPGRLTIGFARRFATYKRANLVFSDLERLRAIGAGRIQFVFSGKAHPRDEGGKALIRQIFEGAQELRDEIPVVFLQDYSMEIGRAMTGGVDVWLNNPIRPMEASGTSGMKAAMNGVPNLSILDGWWPEACIHGVNGWAIGNSEGERDDERDAKDLYRILEQDVLPVWENNRDGWIRIMLASMVASAGFTGARMIQDYIGFYDGFRMD